jgi:hypothetical protein
MSRNQRFALIGGAIAALVIALLIISPGGGSSKKQTRNFTVRVQNAKPVGGINQLSANKGDKINLTVVSDTADEIHIHGYDFHKDVPKNGSVHFSFPAKIDGGFVIELEARKQQIAELKVAP